MEFIRTWAELGGETKETPFLPGSSMKGVIRSHAERILRTLGLIECDITRDDQACVRPGEESSYKDHCLACRTFGSTSMASHVRFTDAMPWKPGASSSERETGYQSISAEQRPGVMISRRTGTVKHGPFELEVVTEGSFFGEITVRNYQLWQLALLVLVFRDMNEGHQRVGAMKSRGLGRVNVSLEEFHIEQFAALAQHDGMQIRGIGSVEQIVSSYGLVSDDAVAKPDCIKKEDGMFRQVFVPDGVGAQEAWQSLAESIMSGAHWRSLLQREEAQE